MGALNNPPPPPPAPAPAASSTDDSRQWKRMFAALVETVQSQQSEIDALAASRTALTDSLHLHCATAATRIALLKSHISQMKEEEEIVRRVRSSRLNLMLSAKEKEALLYREQLELAESDRDDFHACVETLGAEMLELKEKLKCTGSDKGDIRMDDLKTKEQRIADLEKEIRKTKHKHKKLISKKDSDISALVAEKDFISNQLKIKDDDYTHLLKTKQMEDERVSETIKMLQHSLEELQLAADKKDETIASLTTEQALLESDMVRLTQEAEQVKQRLVELQSVDKEKDAMIASLRNELSSFDMSLTKCTSGKLRFSENLASQSGSRNASGALGGHHSRKKSERLSIKTLEGSSSHQRRDVRQRSSRLQNAGSAPVLQTKRSLAPSAALRLFSSDFKVPKLKNAAFP